MPKVSVLMPVYNTKEEYLREAIESILKQTFADFEFVIINDGSSDENVEKVIKSYQDKRIKYIKQENNGLIYTLNKGLEICKGEYIARMDSDDISLPERLEKQIKFLDTHLSVGVLGSWIKLFPKEKVRKIKARPKYFDLLLGNCLAHSSLMLRKSIIDQYHCRYEKYLHAEDYELWSRIIRYTELYNLQEVLLNYRCHTDQVSVTYSDVQIKTTETIKQNMLDFLTDDKKLQQEIMSLVKESLISHEVYCKYNFLQRIFSLREYEINGKKKKILMFLGIKIKIKEEKTYD